MTIRDTVTHYIAGSLLTEVGAALNGPPVWPVVQGHIIGHCVREAMDAYDAHHALLADNARMRRDEY